MSPWTQRDFKWRADWTLGKNYLRSLKHTPPCISLSRRQAWAPKEQIWYDLSVQLTRYLGFRVTYLSPESTCRHDWWKKYGTDQQAR